MVRFIALILLVTGVASGALALTGYDWAGLSWIDDAGETNAWGARGMMVLIGGGILFYSWLDGGNARRRKSDNGGDDCVYADYVPESISDGGGGSADGGI